MVIGIEIDYAFWFHCLFGLSLILNYLRGCVIGSSDISIVNYFIPKASPKQLTAAVIIII